MSHSMTGYGGAVRSYGGYVVQFEIKSVNHRYAEVVLRMPREWTCYEDGLRRLVQRHIKRGRIDVYISKERDESGTLPYVLNRPVVEAYLKAAGELAKHYGVDAKLSAKDLLSLPDVLTTPEEAAPAGSADPGWEQVLTEGLEEALIGLLGMREREGKHLAADLGARLQPMEVAVFADRSNIDEELIRLKSHFEQCRSLLQAYEPVGRKLDFLIQEMNRETNTIGSKANHLALVNLVVEMKAELEKIREQAANLE